MALARISTPVDGDLITAALYNGDFNNIHDNALALISPLTGNLNVNSNDLTSIDETEFVNAAANATVTGRLRRNAANLTWHDGTAAGRIFYAGGTDVPIADGGTNSSAALNNSRIMVSSAGAIVEAGALTNGQLLIGSTGAAPVVATLTPGTNVTITNAAGSITINAASATGGWTDDGTIVRLTTAADQVGIGTASNFRTGAALSLVGSLDWASADGVLPDVRLFRGTANRLEMRPVGGVGSLRVYDVYTDASNNSFVDYSVEGGNSTIQTGQAGTGTTPNLGFQVPAGAPSGAWLRLTNGNLGAWQLINSRVGSWEPQTHRLAGSSIGSSTQLPLDANFGTSYNLWIPQTNGRIRLVYFNEYMTVAGAAFTDTTNLIPVGAVGLGVTTRVGVAIPTAATYDVGIAGATTRYSTGISTALGTESVGPSVNSYTTATAIRITPNLVPADTTGRVRVTAYYFALNSPDDESTPN